MNFEEYLYKVCEHLSVKLRREITEVYSLVDLSEVKLAYYDNIEPDKFREFN